MDSIPVASIAKYKLYQGKDLIQSEFGNEKILRYYKCTKCDLRFFLPLITGSEAFYQALQENTWYYLSDKEEFRVAAAWIPNGSRVLEVGCGRGAFAAYISETQYTGLEFSGSAVTLAQDSGIHVFQESIELHAVRFPESYDVVCSFQVLEHVANVKEFLSASIDAIKPGGILIICVPSEDSYLGLMTNAALSLPPHHVSRWTDKALQSIASLFNLELLNLSHEVVSQLHQRAAASTFVLRVLNRMLRRTPLLLDQSRFHRVLNKVADVLSGLCYVEFAACFPRGHSVLAVYRKPLVGRTTPL